MTFDSAIIISYLEGCSFQEWEEETNEEKLGWLVSATDNGKWPDSQEVEDMAKEFPSQTLSVINKWINDEREKYNSPEAKAEREEEERRYQAMWRSEIAMQAGMGMGIQAYNDHMY